MNHGRSIAAACAIALFSLSAHAADMPAPLRITYGLPDHASGLYHVKDDGKITLTVDNPSPDPREFSGEILFGTPTGRGNEVKPVSVNAIQPTTIPAGQRVRIPLAVTFAGAGEYQLNWRQGNTDTPIPAAPENAGITLQCIFAPRPAKADESPWLALLPQSAVRIPGFLTDYITQTSVRRFLIDERFSYDPRTNVGLGFGASTGAATAQIDALFAETARANARLLLRVAVPLRADAKTFEAFKLYIADAIRRSRGTLGAIAIAPELADDTPPTPVEREAFRALYLAGYEAAKRADKQVVMLGTGSVAATDDLLLRSDPKLLSYIDALAAGDAATEPALAAPLLAAKKLPLFILPPRAGHAAPPAAALAQHASIVPVPTSDEDQGATAHLLNGTVFVQRLAISVPTADPKAPDTSNIPFIALFQGDGYALAAIAGFSAGADLDGQYPMLAKTATHIEPLKADDMPYPNLQVGDDTRSMRVVDSAGSPVDCRIGDNLFIPAGDAMVYLLQAGDAADLAGSILPATANRLPLFEVRLTQTDASALAINLNNISARPQIGKVRLIRPPSVLNQTALILGEKEFPALFPAAKNALTLELPPDSLPLPGTHLVVEITTSGNNPVIQRTAVTLPSH